MLGASMLASTAIGAAKGALEAYLEMTTGRKTRGALAGGGLRMTEFATVQLRVAEAAAAAEAAELILLTDMRRALQKLYAGEEITIGDRIRTRRNQAYATRLAVQAVDLVADAAGMNSAQTSCPIERCWRDVHTATQHVLMNTSRFEVVGRVLFGLDPGSPVI